MAPKKAASKKAPKKGKKGKTREELKALLKMAQSEVKTLLREDKDRNLNGSTLRSGLKEIKGYLDEMGPFEENW